YRRAVGSIARSTRPVDAAPTNSLSWLGRSCSAFHRVARHGFYNCSRGWSPMLKSVLAAALAAGLVVALAPPGLAGSAIRLAQTALPKRWRPQRQKVKDCGGKGQDEKAKTGVKGRAAYRKFMGDCLKKPPA